MSPTVARSQDGSTKSFPACQSFHLMDTPTRHGMPDNLPFSDPATLFIKPDHYVFRLLYAHGVPLEELGVRQLDGGPVRDPQ